MALAAAVALLMAAGPSQAWQVMWRPTQPPSPPAPLSVELPVPLLLQLGDIYNCGPTAVAMMIGAYRGLTSTRDLRRLRNSVGNWTWDRFPMRRWTLPGRDAGLSTTGMLEEALATFSSEARFERLAHPFVPPEAWSLLALEAAVRQGRPALLLVESPVLWGTERAGLHWIVVRGVHEGRFVYNDPADARTWEIEPERLWRAWRLNALFRSVPGIEGFTALVADRPMTIAGTQPTRKM